MNMSSLFFSDSSQKRMESAFQVLEKNTTQTNIFSKNSLPSQPFSEEPEIGRFAYGEKDLSGNTSSLVRQMGPSSPATSALGMTTCWNLPQGLIGFMKARKSYRNAEEIHDTVGQVMAGSDLALRSGQTLGGGSFCFIRLNDVLNNGLLLNRTRLSSAASYGSLLATYGFGALYAAFLPLAGVGVGEINRFLGRMQSVQASDSKESLRRFVGELTGVFPESLPSHDFYEGLGKELRKVLNTSLKKDVSSFSDVSLGRSLFHLDASFSSMKQALWNPGDHSKYLSAVLKNLSISVTDGIKAHDLKKNAELISAIWARKTLQERDVYIHLGMHLKDLFFEIDPKLVKKLSHEELGKALFTDEYRKFLPLVLDRMGIAAKNVTKVSDLQGNQILIRSVWDKTNEAVHGRVFGSKGMSAISKAKQLHLYELLGSKEPSDRAFAEKQSEVLMKELRAGAKENRFILGLYFVTGLLGTIFTGFAESAYSVVGFFCCFVFMWVADFISFQKVCESEGPVGKWDRLYVLSHFLLGVFSTTIATLFLIGVIGAVTYGTGGLFLPIAILMIGSIWMGVDVWAFLQIEERRAKYKKNHPTVQHFLQKVSSKASFEEKEETFHKLPKLMQKQILLAGLERTGAAKDLYTSFDIHPLATPERLKKVALTTRAVSLSNEVDPITEKNFFTHPSKKLFVQNLYNQWVRDGQKKILQRIDRIEGRLQAAVESVLENVRPTAVERKLLKVT
jgi:hypothetical protein